MTPGLNKDLLAFVELLVARGVDFVVVGSYALAFHGHARYTKDIDFFVRNDAANAHRLELLLSEFGFGSLGLSAEDFGSPDIVVQLGYEPNRIDLLTSIDGVAFEEAWRHRVVGSLGGVQVPFISREHLIANKRATDRPQDRADVAALEHGPEPPH